MCFALRIPCAVQGLWLCYLVIFRGFRGGGGFRPFFPFDDPTGLFLGVTLPPQLSQSLK